MQFYNAHTHIFTMNNAPRRFLELYMPRLAASAVDKITNTQLGSWIIRNALMPLFGEQGKRYATFLKIGKSKSQNDVFRHLIESYEDSSIRMVALTLYMEKLGADASMSGYEGQLEEVISLKKRYPERLLPFLCVDPRWKASGEELRDTVSAYFNRALKVDANRTVFPFAGLKIYPSTGFYAFDAKLKPVMEWAAENSVPVMTHCAYMGGIFNNDADFVKASLNPYDPYTNTYYDKPCYIGGKGKKRAYNQRSCSYFLEPHSYESMIRYFNQKRTPLKICFAHFGSNQHMMLEAKKDEANPSQPGIYYGVRKEHNWCAQIRELMTKYPGVYTDISYSLTAPETHPFIFNELKNPDYGDRILFGTDFFMTEREEKEQKTYTAFKNKSLKQVTDQVMDNGVLRDRNAWEKIAMNNVESYLQSRFYDPKARQ